MKYDLYKSIKGSNGDTIDALDLDFQALSYIDIKNARKVKAFISEASLGEVDNATVSPRLDSDLRIGIAWIAAMKTDKRLAINDVLQLSAKDALTLSEVTLTEYLF